MLAVPKIAIKLMPVAGNAQALAKCMLSGYAVRYCHVEYAERCACFLIPASLTMRRSRNCIMARSSLMPKPRRALDLTRIDALAGRYSMDSSTPLTADSWTSAYWSTQSALSALDAVLAGDRVATALCRPPGHHAGADYLGGYCFINQAAVAAQAARDAGIARVAILDIDYHHGNGTQDIFWDRGDVFYASVHADPATDFPFYWGHADEVGEGAGAGATVNLPLPQGTTLTAFRAAQATALDAIARFDPGLLIVSFGADTFEGDPIANFALQTADYATLAQDIAATRLPTVVLTEGGYAVDNLGENLASFLRGF
jgi:acetoin utilization deacetylase AcuC-like enzyme